MISMLRGLSLGALATGALWQLAVAEDVLFSKRSLSKRGLDEEGNYNICEVFDFLGSS